MATVAAPPEKTDTKLSAAAWAAIGKIASKQNWRDGLAPGARHEVELSLSALVDGEPFEQDIAAVLTVGHDQQKATSATPNQSQLVAAILAKLNRATRQKVLREFQKISFLQAT